ncbi:MAG: hypothetical protein PHI47_13690 [Sulfuricurvum sp.]|uniref:carboxymuconolactone decarboxylase family protein n=1 Tax=Sulfuricurvum sp. TaxID=2025608 RepID=UPI002635B101|nr:hypothetical protein [Sulfuricurvum sp.]MDD5161098.1 hypothetical protein [Sulfuricurvum sp.]
MGLLNTVDENTATGVLKEVYTEIKSMFGEVPDGLKMWSFNPEALQSYWSDIKKGFAKDSETQKFETILRYIIAEAEACETCIGFNAGMLINMFGMTQDELLLITKEPTLAPLNDNHKALLLFALKVVRQSKEVSSEDIENLKALGISETEIFDIAYTVTHMVMSDTLLNAFKF